MFGLNTTHFKHDFVQQDITYPLRLCHGDRSYMVGLKPQTLCLAVKSLINSATQALEKYAVDRVVIFLILLFNMCLFCLKLAEKI